MAVHDYTVVSIDPQAYFPPASCRLYDDTPSFRYILTPEAQDIKKPSLTREGINLRNFMVELIGIEPTAS